MPHIITVRVNIKLLGISIPSVPENIYTGHFQVEIC